jgi:hypothetical protein
MDKLFVQRNTSNFFLHRDIINSLFKPSTQLDAEAQIILRLTIIDSLYSTNAAYSYFSIDEMAQKIISLGDDDAASQYFYGIATSKNTGKILFDERYGIRKNLDQGCRQMSLLSKYAYYLLLQNKEKYPLGFPIYDSLALDQFPKVYNRLGIKLNKKLKYKDNIDDYVKALEVLRKELFSDDAKYNFQHFDLLDAYLWRMGKFDVGNISLLNTRQEYTQIIENLELRPSQTTLNKEETEDQKQKKEERFAHQVVAKFKSTSVTDILKNIDNCDEAFKSFLEHWKKIQEIEGEKEE